jgi:hypothetical protein
MPSGGYKIWPLIPADHNMSAMVQHFRERIKRLAAHQNGLIYRAAGKVTHVRRTAPWDFAVSANAALFVDCYDCVVGSGVHALK